MTPISRATWIILDDEAYQLYIMVFYYFVPSRTPLLCLYYVSLSHCWLAHGTHCHKRLQSTASYMRAQCMPDRHLASLPAPAIILSTLHVAHADY